MNSPPPPLTVLFSELNLGPGAYYLALSAPFQNETGGSNLVWQFPTSPAVTTAASVTLGNFFEANTDIGKVGPFPPASTFSVLGDAPIFDVTTVPEPSALVLLSIGLLGFGSLLPRRLRRC